MYCSLNLDYKCLKPHVGIYHLEDAVRDETFFNLGRFFQKSDLGKPQKIVCIYTKGLSKVEKCINQSSFYILFPAIPHTNNLISLTQEN